MPMPRHPCSGPQEERELAEEEAGEMRRKRLSRPRVKLNPVAVLELLDQLGISQKELARRGGPEGDHESVRPDRYGRDVSQPVRVEAHEC